MSTPSNTKQTAKAAAKEDALPTGPAGIPGVQPASPGRAKLTPEQRAKKASDMKADHERLLEQRVNDIHKAMVGLETSSLKQRILTYRDVSEDYIEATLMTIETDLAECRAAQKARAGTAATPAKVGLQALAAKLQAQRNGTPATSQ